MAAKALPQTGMIGLLPTFIQPFSLRTAYALRIGGWSPFGLKPSFAEESWLEDIWPGDEAQGKHIANRRFTLAGCDISFSRHIGWYSKEGSLQWLRALHSFSWMRDVIAYDDRKSGVKLLRNFVEDWIFASDRLHAVAREADVMGERLSNWVLYARVLLKNAPPVFRRRVMHSMVRQALVLRHMMRIGDGDYGLAAIKGVLLVSLTMPQCGFLYRDAMRLLQQHVEDLDDIEHHTKVRNPVYLHATLRSLIDIRNALVKLANKEDAILNTTILHLSQMLVHVLHDDGGFALFNGAVEGNPDDIRQTLEHASACISADETMLKAARQTTGTAMMERTGYARLQAGDTVVLVDTAPSDDSHSDTFYGTLSFEMGHGAQRYIVNCGHFIGNDPAWSRVVKTTAAHSTVCVDDRNSCQFHANAANLQDWNDAEGKPEVERRVVEREGYYFFEGSYNGYAPYAGLLHSRQLLINESGTRFSGADHLTVAEGYENVRSHDVNLRFHLHPSVQAKRLMNGMIILTSADGGEEWTFHSSVGQAVELEESIYLGLDGKPHSTTQIIIYAPFTPEAKKWAIEWSLIRS